MIKKAKKIITFLLTLVVLVTIIHPIKVDAASKNQEAITAYTNTMKAVKNKYAWKNYYNGKICYPSIMYYYKDLNGDGISEAIMLYSPGGTDFFQVYTYKKGKVKLIYNGYLYGFGKLRYYKKSKSFVAWSSGHGHEVYDYYKYTKGKYKKVASKSRYSIRGGSMRNSSWYYFKTNKVNASSFKKAIKGIEKGKVTTINCNKFSIY